MKQHIKDLWVKALRSGAYKQSKDVLKRTDKTTGENSFCCLGVLCELHRKITKKKGNKWKAEDTNSYGGSSTYLPSNVGRWAGCKDDRGFFQVTEKDKGKKLYIGTAIGSNTNNLANLNDRGVSFDEIANVIEERL